MAITPFSVTDFGTNRKPMYGFLLVINTNLLPILHCFQVMADSQIFASNRWSLHFNTLIGGDSLRISLIYINILLKTRFFVLHFTPRMYQCVFNHFLPPCMECRRGLAMRILSVCPSITRVNCDKTVKRLSRFIHHMQEHLA